MDTRLNANVIVSKITHLRFDHITLEFCITCHLASLPLDDYFEDVHRDSLQGWFTA